MNAKLQGKNEIFINATPEAIWAVLEDSTRLSEWAPMVHRTTGRLEELGATRTCDVSVEGRVGQVVERCVEYDRPRRIGWLMVEDTLGFSRLLSEFKFTFVLEPRPAGAAQVVNATYYRPRGLLGRAMNALILRRKFRMVRGKALRSLKQFCEAPQANRQGIGAA